MTKITKITIITGSGADEILLYFDFNTGIWPYEEKAHASMQVAKGNGPKYVKQNFPHIPVNVICSK